MWQSVRRRKLWLWLAVPIAVVVVGLAAWRLSIVDHPAKGRAERTFVMPIAFDKYRQILVRKNATAAIVSHSGLQLLEERIAGLQVDTSADDRPLLNALTGQSKSAVAANKRLVVQLINPELDADRLELQQRADIRPERVEVQTASVQPAGRLQDYVTTLNAVPDPQGTRITLTVELTVVVSLPVVFTPRADQSVQQAAEDAIRGQQEAMEAFVMQYANDLLILPELSRPS